MTSVSTTDFQRDPRPYQDSALREPVTITDHGRDRLVLVAAEEYQRLKRIDDILAGRRMPASPEEDPLSQLLGRLHARTEADQFTEGEIDAELNAYNDEDRL